MSNNIEEQMQSSVVDKLNEVLTRAKSQHTQKSVAMVMGACEEILLQPLETLSNAEKDILLKTLAQCTIIKKSYEEQEPEQKKPSKQEPSR